MDQIAFYLSKFVETNSVIIQNYLLLSRTLESEYSIIFLFAGIISFLCSFVISQIHSISRLPNIAFSIGYLIWGITFLIYSRQDIPDFVIALLFITSTISRTGFRLIELDYKDVNQKLLSIIPFLSVLTLPICLNDKLSFVYGVLSIFSAVIAFSMKSPKSKPTKYNLKEMISVFKPSMLDENITFVLLFSFLLLIIINEQMSILSFLETFNTIAKPVFVAVFLGLIGLSFIIDFTNFKSTGTKLAISLIAGVICLKLSVSLLHYVGVALLTLGIISLENQIRAMLSDYVPQSVTSSFITTFESLSILFPLFGSHFLIVSAFSILILSIVLPQYLRSKTQILMTPYAEKMSRDLPWNEYPRPQFKRDSFFNLNGKWNYKITSSNVIPENIDGEILVPFPLESILSGVGKSLSKTQFLYYKRTFILPNDFVKDKLLLHFGAVDCIATVFLNGKELITHVGGYIPFQIDITSSVNYNSENTLIVRVQDQLDHKYPYGKQRKDRGGMWYTPVSGIWQTVWVESVSNDYIESLKILPDIDRSQVTIQVNGTTSEKTITIYQDDKYQKSILSTTFTDNSTTINIPNAHLWSPEDPHLYYFTISTSTDTIKSYFAMRKFSIDKQQKRLCLNNKPYFFNGLLDQGYFSDGIFLPATSEGYKDDIIRMKELGFNTLRKHIKIEPLIFYYLCDIYGMVIFQDFVNNTDYSFIIDTALPTIGLKKLNDEKFRVPKVNKEIFIQTMNETVSLLYNSPCIGYWTIFNEGWGQFESSRVYHILQKLDSTRIIDSHSGWFNGGESDVESLHIYFKQLYDVESDLPLVLSEFGGYSYKIDENSFNTEHNYGYRLYNDQADFQKGFVNLYENEVMPLIKKGLCACIYTQVSDVEDETNGILTYDRKVCKLKKDEIVEMMKKLKIE